MICLISFATGGRPFRLFIVYVQNLCDPPREVSLQIEANRLGIMLEWAELHPEQSLPIVFPIIYHYGTKPFAGPLDVFELFVFGFE